MGVNRVSSRARIALAVLIAAAATVGGLEAAGEAPAKRRPRHRPPSIRPVGIFGDECTDAPGIFNEATVSDSKVVKIKLYVPVAKGDLFLAAIASHGKVRPPSGWSALPATDRPRRGPRLQVFYKVLGHSVPAPGQIVPNGGAYSSYSFTSSTPQRISGAILNIQGVSGGHPISASAGEVNPRSESTSAPSVRPTSKDALLVFVGAARASVRWTAPRGMRPQYLYPDIADPPARLFIATERWHPAAASGRRTARISLSSRSVGQLIALHFPHPVTCPKVTVLNSRARANARGFIVVRMHCAWAARCRGRFAISNVQTPVLSPYFGKEIAVGPYSIPAGETRRVPIALTRLGRKALKALRHIFDVELDLRGVRSNGQLVRIFANNPAEVVAAKR